MAAPTPTGLTLEEVRALSPIEKRALEQWMRGVAGAAGNRPWWPHAIRQLPLQDRLAQAFDPELDAAWKERERRRVARSPIYFTRNYGHLQPPQGDPIPFAMWEEQEEVLVAFWHRRRVIVLKARQLGLTWLALHFAYWLMGYNPETPAARVLALSKHGGDASKLIARARKIRELLPPYLRHAEDSSTRGSKSELQLEGRGIMASLAGNADAARSETATLVLMDEFAFIRNQQAADTITAAESTIGETGKMIILSTGNGYTGDGAAFAEEWGKASRGESERHPIFIPASTDPVRTPEWRERTRGNYQTEEDFLAEHPETPDQALGGEGTVRVYPQHHLDATVKIGAAIAAHEDGNYFELMVSSQGVELSTDWGDFQTFTVYATALPGGGVYVFDEKVQGHVEPQEASEAILGFLPAGIPSPRFVASSADSAPPGTNRTFARAMRAARQAQPARYPEKHVKVPFGVYKEGGGQGRHGINTVGYLRMLARKAYEFTLARDSDGKLAEPRRPREGWEKDIEQVSGVLAIHPRCKTLLTQMANLERDPKTQKVKKPEMDPRRPEQGDHGPDALVPLTHKRAEQFAATTDKGVTTP